jgi:hypothetical protein
MYSFFQDDVYYVHEQGRGLMRLVGDSLHFIPGSEFMGQERVQVMLPYNGPHGTAVKSGPKKYLLGLFYSGLYLFDGKSFQPFKTEADDFIKTATLYKGIVLDDSTYALSTTGKGLVIINSNGKMQQVINRGVGLQDESVYSIYYDNRGLLWLTLDNGISSVETNSPLTQFTNQSGISTSTLSLSRFNNDLYLGTSNGLMKYDPSGRRFVLNPLIPPNQTFTLLNDDNKLLVANDGLFAVAKNRTYTVKSSVGGDLQLSGLQKLKEHPNVLLGGTTFGVAVFYRTSPVQEWSFVGQVPGIDNQFWTFAENPDGSFWAGTQNVDVYHIIPVFDKDGKPDLSKFTFTKYGAADGLVDGLGSVYNVNGKNYFGGDSALYSFNEKTKRFVPDTTFGTFPNGGGLTEAFLTPDSKGRIWIRFGKETRLATPKAGGGYDITTTPFLPLAETTISAIFPEDDGIVWFTATDGLVRFDEGLQKNYDKPYNAIIRQISSGKKALSLIDSIRNEPVQIDYGSNSIRFEYAAPFFEQEDKTRYQTWLEGFEKDWSDFDVNYYKEYTNLPSGDYHFHVRAINIYNKVSKEAVYTFNIRPPWYSTWWAYLLYALIAIAIVYIIIRWRTGQLHE